jgi:hypothetical protein
VAIATAVALSCGGSAPGGGDGAQPGDLALVGGSDGGGSDGGGVLDGGGMPDLGALTPIDWADAWVDGWYGNPSWRGTLKYDHADVAGPTGYYVAWRGDPGVTQFAGVSDCSSFSDVLLTRVYAWVPPTTHPRPLAADYYWAIRGSNRFTPITAATQIQRGDTIAILYGTSDSGGDSGHVAWIDAAPVADSGGPSEPGLTSMLVTIVDSADGFHFAPSAPQDDRYLGPLDGNAACVTDADCIGKYGAGAVCDNWQLSTAVCTLTGIGRGRMRLYVDGSGTIAGYTWGPSSGSTFYARVSPPPSQGVAFTGRDLVIGRFQP